MKRNEMNLVCDFLSQKCSELRPDILQRLTLISKLKNVSLTDIIREEQAMILQRNDLFLSKVIHNCGLSTDMDFTNVFHEWRKICLFLEKDGEALIFSNYMNYKGNKPGVFQENDWIEDLVEYMVLTCLSAEQEPLSFRKLNCNDPLQTQSILHEMYESTGFRKSELEKRIYRKALDLKNL